MRSDLKMRKPLLVILGTVVINVHTTNSNTYSNTNIVMTVSTINTACEATFSQINENIDNNKAKICISTVNSIVIMTIGKKKLLTLFQKLPILLRYSTPYLIR